MKKGGKILFFFGIILFIIASFYFDNILIKDISYLRNSIVDNFFLIITLVSSEVIIFFVLSALFLWREHKRKWIFPLWASLGLSVIISFILKVAVHRPRPFQLGLVQLLPSLQEASFSSWNFSFPSFQTMLVFSAIPILFAQFPKLKKFWIAFAVLVAFSRLYFGVHFVSDVLSGGVIGYLIGLIVVQIEKKTNIGKKIYEKIFRK
ncbi:Undecaprenyl-diphosphatase [uncultured archaeon]|nr:Undecaprenyl-diphosphatase [uncultured archaeon]